MTSPFDNLDSVTELQVNTTRIRTLLDKVENNTATFYDFQEIKKITDKQAKKHIHKDKNTDTIYADLDFGDLCFTFIIEDDDTVSNAMEKAANDLGKETDYVSRVKHKPYLHVSKIVERHKDNQTFIHIKRNTALADILLKNTKTFYQFLNEVHKHKTDSNRIDELESRIETLEHNYNNVQLKLNNQQVDIQRLESKLGLENMSNKERGIRLLSLGNSIKDISKELGVTQRTIRRWNKQS